MPHFPLWLEPRNVYPARCHHVCEQQQYSHQPYCRHPARAQPSLSTSTSITFAATTPTSASPPAHPAFTSSTFTPAPISITSPATYPTYPIYPISPTFPAFPTFTHNLGLPGDCDSSSSYIYHTKSALAPILPHTVRAPFTHLSTPKFRPTISSGRL
ncbi:hypothetical protein CYMTET_7842 [Cymbomonas tetramitiformis]|uniref:Uncharacterized protein n=1 Tax=Cymbomonas tetramitiformis TaxID=36881 RepID=A0AAE0GUV2_9CHLO|nr:hypothetical protein CYMTET_7842 [Cymbomonas tetramitiformis]